jgi:mannose-6-phosphate isomerase-like protein (cupin superfamily)
MATSTVIKAAEAPVVARGNGVQTTPLVGERNCKGTRVSTGMTQFPIGTKVPFHSHNCDEQVMILDGEALVEVEGEPSARVAKHDTTYIPQGKSHRFVNVGDGPLLILWIYDSDNVTRTFTESGETVPHLSEYDKVAAKA